MSRFIPHPLLSSMLVVMWLMLTKFSLPHLVLSIPIALVAGWTVARLHPARPRIRRIHLIPKLAAIVAWDILKSNLAVARILLSSTKNPTYVSGFVEIKLTLRDQNALAILGIILTSTPGTAWLEYEQEDGLLIMHVLDLRPDEDWQKLISERYETLLLEIFE